ETISRIKSKNSKEMNIVQSADIYVSVSGDDETGDGSLASPFASVSKAIDSAVSGNKIYIMPGEYELDAMTTPHAGYAQAGICDQGKNLEIFGDNERTILYWDGAKSAKRDGPVFALSSYDTVVRNMTIIFSPKSGSNYQRAIFRWCNGRVENVFFRVTGSYAASYIYNNDGGSLRVKNCTFYHDLGKVDGNYSGKGEFINVLTNVNTIGTNTNVMVDDLGENTEETSTIIANSKLSLIYRNNEVGVFYGENSWFGYQMNVPTRYMNAGETMTISIDRICNGKRDMSASDWNWTSSNTSAATVSNGKLTIKSCVKSIYVKVSQTKGRKQVRL
ncbi:MAG: hypothetical protein IJH64_12360, partial [Oscillospiraceae bacterium]|nr:hypothetical protein [Oscillospiraceae bacterium]